MPYFWTACGRKFIHLFDMLQRYYGQILNFEAGLTVYQKFISSIQAPKPVLTTGLSLAPFGRTGKRGLGIYKSVVERVCKS